MKLVSIVALAAVVAAVAAVAQPDVSEEAYMQWRKQHSQFLSTRLSRSYDAAEHEHRYDVWRSNVLEAHELTRQHAAECGDFGTCASPAVFDVTAYPWADMTAGEWAMHMGLNNVRDHVVSDVMVQGEIEDTDEPLPDKFDWRTDSERTVILPVRNQGACGSCWAFSAVQAIEAQLGLHGDAAHPIVPLSTQQLVDCDTEDAGCNGGLMTSAFDYVAKYGLESEADYPYHARGSHCQYDESKVYFKIDGYHKSVADPTQQARDLLKRGPMSVAINANPLMSYRSGVIHDSACRSKQQNHGVLTVGWTKGDEAAADGVIGAWTIKNSWGGHWGDGGYFRIVAGVDACGVEGDVSIPFVN